MDVCPIKKISRLQFLNFFKYYKKGTHFDEPSLKQYVSYHKCKKATINGVNNLPVCFDGDTAFLNGTVTFELIKDAVKIIIPKPDSFDTADSKIAAEIF